MIKMFLKAESVITGKLFIYSLFQVKIWFPCVANVPKTSVTLLFQEDRHCKEPPPIILQVSILENYAHIVHAGFFFDCSIVCGIGHLVLHILSSSHYKISNCFFFSIHFCITQIQQNLPHIKTYLIFLCTIQCPYGACLWHHNKVVVQDVSWTLAKLNSDWKPTKVLNSLWCFFSLPTNLSRTYH